jgi:ornithine decarboxylase
MEAKFILSKKKVLDQFNILKDLGLKVSYSYKTNREVGNLLQELDCDFSIHAKEEIDMVSDKSKVWFFLQAENSEELKEILGKGIKNFVVDNPVDLGNLLKIVDRKINLSLRMKFQEHRIGTGKYFVYGMSSNEINKIIFEIKDNSYIEKLGVHIHRKSQNTSEWEIKSEIQDSLNEDSLKRINFLNIGGGLPTKYKSYKLEVLDYIFEKIKDVRLFLEDYGIETYIEPGRFIASPPIKLITEIIQVQGKNIIINTTLYNCALDTLLTGTKMLIENELDEGNDYLIKGNSPTRDDIFRYSVKLNNPKVGDKIVFLNAGAYNYTTDFFGYVKLKTEVVEDF